MYEYYTLKYTCIAFAPFFSTVPLVGLLKVDVVGCSTLLLDRSHERKRRFVERSRGRRMRFPVFVHFSTFFSPGASIELAAFHLYF